MKFADYPRVQSLRLDDIMLIDGTRGTKSVLVEHAIATITGEQPPQPVLTPEDLPLDDLSIDPTGVPVLLYDGQYKMGSRELVDFAMMGLLYGGDTGSAAPMSAAMPTKATYMSTDFLWDLIDNLRNGDVRTNLKKQLYRGKKLGKFISDDQWANINDGSFRGIFLGDYWILEEKIFRVIDFNYYMGALDEIGNIINSPHILFRIEPAIIGDDCIASMDESKFEVFQNTSLFKRLNDGPYLESVSRLLRLDADGNPTPGVDVSMVGVSKLLTSQENYYTNMDSVGGSIWLPSQSQIFGREMIPTRLGDTGVVIEPQFALFRECPEMTTYGLGDYMPAYWLRDFVLDDPLCDGSTYRSGLEYLIVELNGIVTTSAPTYETLFMPVVGIYGRGEVS